MSTVVSNELTLEYDTFGPSSSPPVLLISGLGSQMIAWREQFCELLVEAGAHVIRFDNRDTGRSSWLDDLGVPILPAVRDGAAPPPYTLADMASDAVGLLDALAIPAAHIVGMSLGGYVAQLVAIEHPDRVLSLTSIMSSLSGVDAVPGSFPVEPPVGGSDPAAFVEQRVAGLRAVSGPHFDEVSVRALLGRMLDRGVNINGVLRHAAAGVAAASRLPALGKLSQPVLVVHGDADTRIPLENGIRTAGAVPGSRLLVIPEMGHELPAIAWPVIVAAIQSQLADDRVTGGAEHLGDRSAQAEEVCVQTVIAAPPASVRPVAAELTSDTGWRVECDVCDWNCPATRVTITTAMEPRADRTSVGEDGLQQRTSTVRDVVEALARLRQDVPQRSPR